MNRGSMQAKGPYHFHNGHYLAADACDSLRQIENPHYDEIICDSTCALDDVYNNAYVFLHGSCHLFALALHEWFGYDVFEVCNYAGVLEHVFCKSVYRGKEVFVDVRGMTTDIDECFAEFNDSLHYDYHITPHDIAPDELFPDSGDKTGFRFAQDIIDQYRQYYEPK